MAYAAARKISEKDTNLGIFRDTEVGKPSSHLSIPAE